MVHAALRCAPAVLPARKMRHVKTACVGMAVAFLAASACGYLRPGLPHRGFLKFSIPGFSCQDAACQSAPSAPAIWEEPGVQDRSDDALLREVGARLHARISTEAQAVIDAAVQQMEAVDSEEREGAMEQHVAEVLSKWLISRKFADQSHPPPPLTMGALAEAGSAPLEVELALVEDSSVQAKLDLLGPSASAQDVEAVHQQDYAERASVSNGSTQTAATQSGMLAARKLRDSGAPCPKATDAASDAPADDVFVVVGGFTAGESPSAADVAVDVAEDVAEEIAEVFAADVAEEPIDARQTETQATGTVEHEVDTHGRRAQL